MEASIFARWIDRTYRPQLPKQGFGGLGEASLQQALQQTALKHLTCSSTMGLQACVQAQQEHEQDRTRLLEAQARLRNDELQARLLGDEAALCEQLMELLEGFMSDYSNARYTEPQAKLDALELKLQARRGTDPNPNNSSSPNPNPNPNPHPHPHPNPIPNQV